MVSTSTRIKTDIKKNVSEKVQSLMRKDGSLMLNMEADIRMVAEEMSDNLKDIATRGTKAGDAELRIAVQFIEQEIAKCMVVTLKEKYNLKI